MLIRCREKVNKQGLLREKIHLKVLLTFFCDFYSITILRAGMGPNNPGFKGYFSIFLFQFFQLMIAHGPMGNGLNGLILD